MIRLFFALLLALSAAACGGPAPEPTEQTQLYTCSMHPQVVQDHPGPCPVCGMDLVPMNANTDATAPTDVHIDPGLVQQIGVETAPVERTTVFRHVRAIGEVEVGEDQVGVVNLRFSGWVERLLVQNTGEEVQRGQVLFEIYSPELVAAQEDFLQALRTQGPDSPLATSARRRLELWDLATQDIDAIAQSGQARRAVPVRAPMSGYVLHKDLVEGARVGSGQDLYRIGNLTKIWIRAEIYEHDAPWIELGQAAQAELTHLPGEVLEGRVTYIYPTLNERSRTLAVRLEFENPGVRLKPGMFATVYVQFRRLDGVLAVPTEAILYSGRRTLAFVALGGGRFEPRQVTVGLVGDHRMVEIREGLKEGEQVVTSGQFLIDSESQLQEALAKILTGAQADAPAPPVYWTCPMHPEVHDDGPGRCPECGMFLEERLETPEPTP